MKVLYLLFATFFPLLLSAQDPQSSWLKKLEKIQIKPIIGLQMWSSYTIGTKVFTPEDQSYQAVDNRLNIQLRRARMGLKSKLYPNLKINLTTSLDLVGRDLLSGTDGNANNGGSPKFRIWNAYLQWKMLKDNECLNLTIGYLIPQIGRASITAALRSTSMEKAWSQYYLRRHLTGTGPGRAMGINLGGLIPILPELLLLSYDLGLFNPLFQAYNGNSTGYHASPLLIGRVVFHLGDPEQKNYSISHKVNYFSKRKGVSIALSGVRQGVTDLFTQNTAFGGDLLFNWSHFNLDGEWTFLQRNGFAPNLDHQSSFYNTSSNTGYIRLGYNLHLKNHWILEPVLMMMQFNGPLDSLGQKKAKFLDSNSGKDHNLDFGVNLYFNPNLKLSLHYTFRDGNAGADAPGSGINNYFYQPGIGAIQRGEWFGLGLVAIL